LLPHRRSVADAGDAIDEERRLCYVGVTRAQEELTLTMAQARFKWGKERPTFPSRFLYELTGQADHPNKAKSIRGSMAEFSNAGSMAKTPQEKNATRAKSISKKPSTPTKPTKGRR
jgi:DNA helicase-2/ATP-dependent DNA helicase PcrA